MTTGTRIRDARISLGLNQSDLACLLSITPQSVQHWESDRTTPRGKRIEAIATILNVSPEWLSFGTTQPDLQENLTITVSDESMSPRIIKGDKVLIDRNCTQPKDRKVYAISVGSDIKLRRFTKKINGDWLLSCDNKQHEQYNETFSSSELKGINILGRVYMIVSGRV